MNACSKLLDHKAWIALLVMATCSVSCESSDTSWLHTSWQNVGFYFALSKEDHQDTYYVVDYRLSSDRYTLVDAPEESVKKGMKFYSESVGGMVDRPRYLYVHWHDTETNKEYEKSVDLQPMLPKNIDGDQITFMLKGDQIYVYLVTKNLRPASAPPIGYSMYQGYLTLQLYPRDKP